MWDPQFKQKLFSPMSVTGEQKSFDPSKYGLTDYAQEFKNNTQAQVNAQKKTAGTVLSLQNDLGAKVLGATQAGIDYNKVLNEKEPGDGGDGSGGKGLNVGATIGLAADALNGMSDAIFGKKRGLDGPKGELTTGIDSAYNTAADAVMKINPMVGGIMKGAGFLGDTLNKLGGGTDGMTTGDAVLNSAPMTLLTLGLNGFLGNNSDTFTKNNEVFAQLGLSQSGTNAFTDMALDFQGKKYGAISSGARKDANALIAEAKRQQSTAEDMSLTAMNRFNLSQSMSAINSNQRAFNMQGGYQQNAIHVGRYGMVIQNLKEAQKITMASKHQTGGPVGDSSYNGTSTKTRKTKTKQKPVLMQEPTQQFKQGGQLVELSVDSIPNEYKEASLIEISIDNILPEFKEGGSVPKLEEGNPIEYSIKRFPILSTLPEISLQYDPDFNPREDLREEGYFGDIEYVEAQYDDLPYYRNYPKLEEFKGKSTIIYNDKVSNEDIALDWLSHGLREYDQQWKEYLQRLPEDPTWAKAINEELFWTFAVKKGINPDNYDQLSQQDKQQLDAEFNNAEIDQEDLIGVVDGIIRALVVKPDHRETYGGSDWDKIYGPLKKTQIWKEMEDYLFNNPERFQKGGKFNVIPEGALHARLHHMEGVDNLTKKGIPVVSQNPNGDIEQQAEIEREEIIFRLEVTKKLEELAKDGSDEAAIEAGKLLVEEILYNTIDNTNNLI